MRPREMLSFEAHVYALAGRDDTMDFLHELVDAWLAPPEIVAEKIGVEPDARRASAGHFPAVTRGLLLTLLASGNLREIEATMQHFLANNMPLQEYEAAVAKGGLARRSRACRMAASRASANMCPDPPGIAKGIADSR